MMKCIIVEDEPIARSILKSYISDAHSVELEEEFSDAVSALSYLNENKVDLIFLDIRMPKLSGISFLKGLNNPPKVILTTAYSEYALEGYELDVVDYLLKPFSFERFLKAINKISASGTRKKIEEAISVKADGKLYRIKISDILYAESKGDYITVHTFTQKLTFNQTLTSFVKELPQNEFVRVHRSFMVSIGAIDFIEGNRIFINKAEIPIGKSYKEEFERKL